MDVIKYIFYIILSALLFTACDDEKENQRGENLVVGIWNSYHENTDSLILTRVFTADFHSYFSFADGVHQSKANQQSYRLNGNFIILEKYTQEFRIEADTMWITNSKQDQITKYIRQRRSK